MTEAPERIWLTADDPNNRPFVTRGPLAAPPRTEYVRADIAEDGLTAAYMAGVYDERKRQDAKRNGINKKEEAK